MDNHDAIGRVVLHLDKFEPDTVYTLKYNLIKGDIADKNVSVDFDGTVSVYENLTNEIHLPSAFYRTTALLPFVLKCAGKSHSLL